jgi:TubC N-terminal docking domain
MTAATLLADLFRQGALVTVLGDRIRIVAPKGVLTPAIRTALATHKADLLQLLTFAGEYRDALRTNDRLALVRFIDELGPALAVAIREVVNAATVSDIA